MPFGCFHSSAASPRSLFLAPGFARARRSWTAYRAGALPCEHRTLRYTTEVKKYGVDGASAFGLTLLALYLREPPPTLPGRSRPVPQA
jgi:hypothetical protein